MGLGPTVGAGVAVEGLAAGHKVPAVQEGHGQRDVAAAAAHVAVLAAQPLGPDAQGAGFLVAPGGIAPGLILGTDAVAVAGVVVAFFDAGIPGRRAYGVATPFLTARHNAQTVHRANVYLGNVVLVAVAVATVDALAVHHGELIVEVVVKQVAVDHGTQVAAVVHAVQGVGTFTGQIQHGL